MKSLADKLKDIIKLEEKKNDNDKNFKEFGKLLIKLDELGHYPKPDYSLPLVDTIGKTTYSTLNKHLV